MFERCGVIMVSRVLTSVGGFLVALSPFAGPHLNSDETIYVLTRGLFFLAAGIVAYVIEGLVSGR